MSLIRQNVRSIAKALQRSGAVEAVLHYSGSGDSGDINNINYQWPEKHALFETSEDEALGTVEIIHRTKVLVNEEWVDQTEQVEVPVEEAITDLWHDIINTLGMSGFGNGEGGQGWLTIDAEGHCSISHSNNEMRSTRSEHEFTEKSPLWPNLQRVASALQDIGAEAVVVEYEGRCDEGGVDPADIRGADDADADPDVALLDDPADPQGDTTVVPLSQAAQELAEAAITEADHDDYTEDEGGRGVFTIHADGRVTLEHVSCFMDDVDGFSHNFDADEDVDGDAE